MSNIGKRYFLTPDQYLNEMRENRQEVISSEIGKIGANYYLKLMEHYPNFYNTILSQKQWGKMIRRLIIPFCDNGTFEKIKKYSQTRYLRNLPLMFAIISDDIGLKKDVDKRLEKIIDEYSKSL